MFNRYLERSLNFLEAAANHGRRYWRRASSRARGLMLNPFVPLD
jgi:hypothetical protein